MIRAAIRQLERADVYLAAVAYMDLDDAAVTRAIQGLRGDVEDLRRHLVEVRASMSR